MTTKLIGRAEECEILENLLQSDRPEFLALYGRRRIGKTFLIRTFFQKKNVVFFNVTGSKEGMLKEQVRHFMEQIADVFLAGIVPSYENSWDHAFRVLTDAMASFSRNKKIVLFFDELPWMATRNSKLLQHLDYYWNQHWSANNKIKLIICGSSASWIINKIIKSKSGLHNRITGKMRLEPFTLLETKKFLTHQKVNLTHRQITQVYMVTGGVPYYLTYIKKNLSAMQVIEKLAFSKESVLLEEFDNLLASLFDEHKIYVDIVRYIAQSRCGIDQKTLLKRLGKSQSGGRGLDKLRALEEAGFIMRFHPHFNQRKGVYYKVIDEYTLFYLHWIEPIRRSLQVKSLERGNWQEMQNSPAWNSWQGYAFEAICYKHIAQIRKKLAISPTAIANSWRYVPTATSSDAGAQIDLLFDRRDEAITLCEIKHTNKPFAITKQYAKNLLNKREVFAKRTGTKKQLFIAMIASSGLQANLYVDDLIDGVVTLDDLFK